jgi:hypothetical protein
MGMEKIMCFKITPKNPLARHSRAGGNPARKISGEAAKTAMLPRYAGHDLIVWIPACAGMTHFCSIERSGIKRGMSVPSPQPSGGTTSHSTKRSKNDSQVAGYPAFGRGVRLVAARVSQ